MPQKYCPSCGKPNQYLNEAPLFCGFCQGDLNAVAGSIPSRTPTSKPTRPSVRRHTFIERDEEEEYNSARPLPDIQKLDVSISVPELYRETVGEVIGSNKPAGAKTTKKLAVKLDKRKHQDIDSKSILKQFTKKIAETTRIDLNPNEQ